MTRRLIVERRGDDARPPAFAIRQAEEAAARSGCLVSRRGVSAYVGDEIISGGSAEIARELVGAEGANGPPWRWRGADPAGPLPCDGSEACQRDCGRRCMHAEVRAFLAAQVVLDSERVDLLRMVHVKIGVDGLVMPSRGPSCLSCATFLLDQGVGGIWLCEQEGRWRYYAMDAFYEATCRACQVYPGTGVGTSAGPHGDPR